MSTTTTTTTMTSTIPRPPPTGPLPALPVAKTRSRSTDPADRTGLSSRRSSTASQLPAPPSARKIPQASRSVTTSGLPTPRSSKILPPSGISAPAMPALNTAVAAVSDHYTTATAPSSPGGSALPKTVRKVSSIGSFPLPPKAAATRITSLPPSPLSASTSSNDANAAANKQKRDSSKHRSAEVSTGAKKSHRSSRSSGYGVARPRTSGTGFSTYSPSLLNHESDFISAGDGPNGGSKQHDSLLSLPSPPQSRSSSANGFGETGDDDDTSPATPHATRGRQRRSDTTFTAPASSTASRRESDIKDKDTKGNVLVSVRVRPDAGGSGDNAAAADQGEWLVDGRRSLIAYKGKEGGDYRYDNVFSPHDNNGRVYDNAAKRLVRRVMEGYHGTVFAYGMTGTGKTFSMQGTSSAPGVIPLAITDIFSYIRENPNREFLLRVSYLEIYNERIYDLLSQSTPGQPGGQPQEEIKLREDAKRGVYATPLKEEIVQSPNQLLRVIARGDAARRVGSTQFNARSSRSHAVVQIVVESRERTPSGGSGAYFEKEARRNDRILPGGVLVSTLSLIDLAGSEKAAENKERRQEGAHINKSLLTLGTVIARLSTDEEKDGEAAAGGAAKTEAQKEKDKEKATKHLPYRDSKLTRLLQPALSGNSLVSILCTVQLSSAGTSAAHASSHVGETLNTLKFASRAKNNIVSHAKRNENNNPNDPGSRALLDRYRLEIQELRAQLEKQSKANANTSAGSKKEKAAEEKTEEEEEKDEIARDLKREEELEKEQEARHEEQMLEMQLARTALKERISHLNRLILSSKSLGVNSGRFSNASLIAPSASGGAQSVAAGGSGGMNRRLSTFSLATDFGRPVSNADQLMGRYDPQRDSTATLNLPSPADRPGSLISPQTNGSTPTTPNGRDLPTPGAGIDDDDAAGDVSLMHHDDGEGNASMAQQIRMLQADLGDKNRYIATLEKRLLQARRTSHSRVSMQFASRVGLPEEGSLEGLLRERDREIEELRAKLDDQMRMVTALRSAARKREMLDGAAGGSTTTHSARRRSARQSTISSTTSPVDEEDGFPEEEEDADAARRRRSRSAHGDKAANGDDDSVPDLGSLQSRRHHSSSRLSNMSNRTSTQSLRLRGIGSGHRSNPSTASRSSTNFSRMPLSPTAILASPTLDLSGPEGGETEKTSSSRPSSVAPAPRRKDVDEMTMLLDQMIQDKVESGHVVRGERGSLRVRPSIGEAPSTLPAPPPGVSGGVSPASSTASPLRELQLVKEMKEREQRGESPSGAAPHGVVPGGRRMSVLTGGTPIPVAVSPAVVASVIGTPVSAGTPDVSALPGGFPKPPTPPAVKDDAVEVKADEVKAE